MLCQESNTTVIGRLRIRSKSSDPQAEQERIARMLRSATLHPAGLPESAMLFVRRLADPLPSRLRAGPRDLLLDISWQRAVAGALERLAASAARPAYGAVPAETDAVLFHDRAEVLASLARDWMNGTLSVQWWWRELLRGRDAVTALLREWLEAPQYVPGALDLLAQRGDAVKFVQRLPKHAVAEMLQAVISAYSLPSHSAEELVSQNFLNNSSELLTPSPYVANPQESAQRIAFQAATSRWAPEAFTPGLAPLHTMLLVQALMLRRAPAKVRTSAFQRELLRWHAISSRLPEVEAPEAAGERPDPASPTSEQKFFLPEVVVQAAPEQEAGELAPAPQQSELKQPPFGPAKTEYAAQNQNTDITQPVRKRSYSHSENPRAQKTDSPNSVEPALTHAIVEKETFVVREPAELSATRAKETQAAQIAEPTTTFETEYGGVFFLLTLALHLYIYGDFTSPTEPGLELNLWDFLALIGSELTEGGIEKDPVWEQLAFLAGRPGLSKPGSDFNAPDEWRLPPEWLVPFPEVYDTQPVLSNGRMVSRHPAGFIVLDLPAEVSAPGEKNPMSHADRLQRWVHWMSAYFRARLVRALGREDAAAFVCGGPARVVFTLTHVDVMFSLDQHPIEIRMAGLDRDLGWIPAAGRYVSFQFR